ncbi:MAG: valine--tRNA ligase [Trueperaceae bacterium]|nr:valine--tRNA ligase [Trueperaceae bacterium]
MTQTKELAKQYSPFDVEARWSKLWAEEPFRADPHSGKEPFCIVIPPPNVTGNLHLGHAFDNAIIDTLTRFKRMQGFEALFQPGTDHAGISTQVMVERELREEGKTKDDLGREAFLERVWQWKQKYGDIIVRQLQRLGVSADWSRSRFTMDEGLSRAVRKQFVELYHQGRIYQGERIVNWDPVSQTTLSDLEVDREQRPGKLYTIAYDLEGGGSIQIATVRPETIFADQAIAVHPDDERFKDVVGKKARIPLTDRWVPVLTDEAVEMDFGTGALKITPAHDPTDFEIGERQGLEHPSVIDLNAKLAGDLVPERFRGMDRFEARPVIATALEAEGALVKLEDYTVSLGLSERTKEPVEPILSKQWFYDVTPVAKRVLAALDDSEISVHPERYTKVNRDWLEKIRPWNISRQLWWGHQIPAWFDDEGNVYVPDPENPDLDCDKDPRYEGKNLRQDPDVFDTWFSSSLWPFSTLGWPDDADPFYQTFFPTSVLVTGYDILFFWVARMEMAAYELVGERPFRDVLLHGLVLDPEGQKMSKSKGNGIDPLDVIDELGADALRFAMTYVSTGGQDIRWDPRRVEMGRNFNNKLWNATRFALMNLEGESLASEIDEGAPETLADRWMLSRLQKAIRDATTNLERYDLGAANRGLYDFVWSEFCDWYLEAAKPQLRAGNARTRYVLRRTLVDILKLLHPLIPFITSELYEALGADTQLGYADWPTVDESLIDEEAERDFARLQDAVGAARNLRAEATLPPSQQIPVRVAGDAAETIYNNAEVFEILARASLQREPIEGASLSQIVPDLELRLPLVGLVDLDEWRARQQKRLGEAQQNVQKSRKKLANDKFVANAPDEVVAEERRRLAEAEEIIEGLEKTLAQLEETPS